MSNDSLRVVEQMEDRWREEILALRRQRFDPRGAEAETYRRARQMETTMLAEAVSFFRANPQSAAYHHSVPVQTGKSPGEYAVEMELGRLKKRARKIGFDVSMRRASPGALFVEVVFSLGPWPSPADE